MASDSSRSPEYRRSKKLFSNTHDKIVQGEEVVQMKNTAIAWNRNSKDKSESRSRSRSNSRYNKRKDRFMNSRSRSQNRRRSRSKSPGDGARLHVADIDDEIRKSELNREFEKYGPVEEIWVSRTSPRFAFVVFENQADADAACDKCDGMRLGHRRIRVTHARPRVKFYGGGATRGTGRGNFKSGDQRCYQCGEVGHFSRNCLDTKFGYKRPPSPNGRSYSRSQSPQRGARQERRSPPRYRPARRYQPRRSRSRESRDRMRSPSYERKRSNSTSRY